MDHPRPGRLWLRANLQHWPLVLGLYCRQVDSTATVFVGRFNVPQLIVLGVPIAIVFCAIGVILYLGLPNFYRQFPATIPGFYISLYRRKVVPWFFVMIILRNYWLSAPFGRSWQSSRDVTGCGWVCWIISRAWGSV